MAEIETFPDAEAWAGSCAVRLADTLSAALAETGTAVFAGAGGSTPSPIYARLAHAPLDWAKIVVTLVDERYVPESSSDSNAALMKRTLLTGPAAAARFIPLYSPQVTIDRAAAVAAHALADEGGRIDAALLGMGEDGHICSMFPGNPALKSLLSPALRPTVFGVAAGRDGMPPSLERLSINVPYLTGARRVILALTGAKKREVFEREAAGDPDTHPIAALIAHGAPLEVLWTEAA